MHNPAQQKASDYFNLFATPAAETMLAQNDFAMLQRAVFGSSTTAKTAKNISNAGAAG